MEHTLGNPDDKPVKAEKGDRLEEQLSFKSRFVLVFGEVNDSLAQAICRRLLALSADSDAHHYVRLVAGRPRRVGATRSTT